MLIVIMLNVSVSVPPTAHALKCYNCPFGIGSMCITTETNCSVGDHCFSGKAEAGERAPLQHTEPQRYACPLPIPVIAAVRGRSQLTCRVAFLRWNVAHQFIDATDEN